MTCVTNTWLTCVNEAVRIDINKTFKKQNNKKTLTQILYSIHFYRPDSDIIFTSVFSFILMKQS